MKRLLLLSAAILLAIVGKAQGDESADLRYRYFFLEAVCQQQKGNYAAAFDLLRYARELRPDAAEVYFQLSGYYTDLKNDSIARMCFMKAAQLAPGNDTYQERLGQYYITQREYDKAIDTYEQLYSHHRDRTDVLQLLYRLYGTQNNYAKMIETLERVETTEGASEQLTLAKMQIYEQQGEKEKVVGELNSLVEHHPGDAAYRVMLANWLLQNDRPSKALEQLQAVLADEPDHVAARVTLLDYYRRCNLDSKADGLLRELLLSDKVDQDTRLALMRQVIADNEKSGSDSTVLLRLIDEVLQKPQPNADMLMIKAAYEELKKMPADSIKPIYARAIEVEPDNANARYNLLQYLWREQDFAKVIELCRPAQQYNPDDMLFYYYQGFAHYQREEYDEALETFRKGVGQINSESNPDMVADFYSVMGDLLHRKNLDSEAYAAYDSCLQWKPDHLPTLNNYAYYLSIGNGDLDKAERMSMKAVKGDPTNSTFLDTLAWILFLRQRYDEAKAYMERAISNSDDLSEVVLEHAGDIFAKSGDMEQAMFYWQKALEKDGSNKQLKKKIKLKQYVEN